MWSKWPATEGSVLRHEEGATGPPRRFESPMQPASYGRDGPMNATIALLGTVMLLLVGLAAVLAVVILILYEARWIVRLGRQLTRAAAVVDPAGRGAEGGADEGSAA